MEQEKNIFDYLKPKKGEIPTTAYFEKLAQDVVAQEKKVARIIPLYKKPLFWLVATAASIALLLVFSTKQTEKILLTENESVSHDAIFAYIEENIDEFDTYLIAEFVDEEKLIPEKVNVAVETRQIEEDPIKELEEVELDDILDYFEYEGIDIEQLEDELNI